MSYDTANCARVYQHDVRAKQTKVCDAERAGFQTPGLNGRKRKYLSSLSN